MVIMLSGREDMTEISGVEMADVGDVVVVTVESRHGSLGYLASPDGQGIWSLHCIFHILYFWYLIIVLISLHVVNFGLLDQTLALKWIQENIDLFGGDSERITVLGII